MPKLCYMYMPVINSLFPSAHPLQSTSISMIESSSLSRYLGVIYAILSGISFTLYNTFFKMVQQLSISDVILVRGVIQIFLILPFLIALRPNVGGAKGSILLMWFGSVISTLTVALAFFAVSLLPFGDAMAIHFCSPVVVMILSHCLLKEYCGLYKSSVVALLLVGVTLIAKPPGLVKLFTLFHLSGDLSDVFDADAPSGRIPHGNMSSPLGAPSGWTPSAGDPSGWTLYGYMAALLATTTWSCCTLIRKKLSESNHFSVIIFSCAVANIIFSSVSIPLLSSFSLPDSWMEVMYAVVVGVFSMAGVMFHILSLRRMSASLVSMVRSLEIVMAYLVQIFWFQESPDVASLVGAGVVMMSVFFITQEENIMEQVNKLRGVSEETDDEEDELNESLLPK